MTTPESQKYYWKQMRGVPPQVQKCIVCPYLFCVNLRGRHLNSSVTSWKNRHPLLSPPVLMHGGLLCIALRLSVCPSVCDWTEIHWTIIHISKTVAVRDMKFGQNMHVGNPNDDLQGQAHRSKVRVTRSKRYFQVSFDCLIGMYM